MAAVRLGVRLLTSSQRNMKVYFVTGNERKLEEVKSILVSFFNFLKILQKIPQASSGAKIELERVKIDLDEYQAKMCKKLRVLRENSKEKRKL